MSPLWRARVLAHARADAAAFDRELPDWEHIDGDVSPGRVRPTLVILRRTLASGSVEDLRALWLACDELHGAPVMPPTDAAELVRMLAWRRLADAIVACPVVSR
jgi:hypothetical protein